MANRFRTSMFQLALRAQGINFKAAFEAAVRNQDKGPADLYVLQQQRFDDILRSAAADNAAYQQFLHAHETLELRSEGVRSLSSLPLLNKDELARIAAAVPSRSGIPPPIVKRTSGSSGRPLALFKQRSGLAMELAATWRSYGWYGINPGDRHVRIWGRPLNWRKRAFNVIKGTALNSIQISAFDVTAAELRTRLQQIRASKPSFLYGYASALRELAEFAIAENIVAPESLRAVVSTAEPLDDDTRRTIETAFATMCRDEYGCSEVGSIAHECNAGQMHIMADNLIAEVMQDDGTISRTGFGELLVTDLTNELTPVIRYQVGDFCELSAAHDCDCGVHFPVIRNILGRIEDTIVMPDGTRHHPAKLCYLVDKIDEPFHVVKQFQVIQKAPAQFELRIVPDGRFPIPEFEARARSIFRNELDPDTAISVREVSSIAREKSGKFKIVVALGGE